MPPSTLKPVPAPSLSALALRQSQIPALRRLAIEETNNAVIILGRVPSYYLKQLAQEAVMPTLAGRKLLNRVTVTPELPQTSE